MDSNIWLKNYPKGVSAEIDLSQFENLIQLLDYGCIKYRNLKAFSNMGQAMTFDEVMLASKHFASYIQNHTDLKPGDRIAIQMPNLLQYPVVLIGALRAGLVVVNTNPLYTPREMEHQLKDSGAKAIVILENFASKLESIIQNTDVKLVITTGVGDLIDGLKGKFINFAVRNIKKMVPKYTLPGNVNLCKALELGQEKPAIDVHRKQDDIAFLQYTGGTTGVAKGAMLTNKNILANVIQAGEWISGKLHPGSDVVLTALPLYHIFALTVNFFIFIYLGGHNILITNPREMRSMIKDIRKYGPSIMTGVNTLFNGLLNQEDFRELDFSNLNISVAGGMALQSDVAKRWKKITDSEIMEGFGLTEASPATHFNPADGRTRDGSIGFPLPSTQVKIVDDQDQEVAIGEIGELCIKGPQVMAGYWQRQDETDNVLKDGWLHTGDIAKASEDGYFYIVDRKKDMISVSGFKVFPNEVEDVLVSHPGVSEAACVGIPDEHTGEMVKAFVVRAGSVSVEELMEYCKANLTNYKRPRAIEFRDELPKSNVGKILRRPLRDEELAKRGAAKV